MGIKSFRIFIKLIYKDGLEVIEVVFILEFSINWKCVCCFFVLIWVKRGNLKVDKIKILGIFKLI